MNKRQAYSEMLAVFASTWPSQFTAIYPDVAGSIPAKEEPWARLSVTHGNSYASLTGDLANRIFEDVGILTIQVFVPMGGGRVQLYELCDALEAAYNKAKGSVWYRNVTTKELGKEGAFEVANVVITFSYRKVQ